MKTTYYVTVVTNQTCDRASYDADAGELLTKVHAVMTAEDSGIYGPAETISVEVEVGYRTADLNAYDEALICNMVIDATADKAVSLNKAKLTKLLQAAVGPCKVEKRKVD